MDLAAVQFRPFNSGHCPGDLLYRLRIVELKYGRLFALEWQ